MPTELQVGREIRVLARVHLGTLTPDDVRVELLVGRVNADGLTVYEASAVPCRASGLHGYTLRALPHHSDLTTPFQPGLIVWAEAI